jgi:tRNA pseudouridine38-40 synthase
MLIKKKIKSLVQSKYYRLTVEFCGTRFLGWQKQKDFSPTVQDELEKALSKIFKSDDIHTIGSGRTDTGVHSLSHIVKIKVPFDIEKESLKRAINSNLKVDIRVKNIDDCLEEFRPTNDAKSREYMYLFSNSKDSNAFQENFIPNISFELDIDKMKKACGLFVGNHDFLNFYCTGSQINSTHREIFKCSLEFHELEFHNILPSHYVFRIEGSGFLKQMVRLIIGTIWQVGRGKVTLESLERELANPGKQKLGITAPACGLYKTSVKY